MLHKRLFLLLLTIINRAFCSLFMEGRWHEEPQFDLIPCKCNPAEGGASGRRLVVCIDGSSHQFGTKNTNVVELHAQIMKFDEQIPWYHSGIGTYARPSNWMRAVFNKIDLAIAINIEKVIMEAYKFLSDAYEDGDKIYLFGYSRGAYQVRVLAGMIEKIGLICRHQERQIPFAYELYADQLKHPKGEELAANFKRSFCRENVRIHFVGVWDTISSVGLFRGKLLPLTTESCDHICIFRHALALDECRVKFLPEYVFGARSAIPDEYTSHTRPHVHVTDVGSSVVGDGEGDVSAFWEWEPPRRRYTRTTLPRIKEVWFAGSHADVGGGNRENIALQAGNIPLRWMRNEAIMAGLILRPTDIDWKTEDLERRPERSLKLGWWLMELLPVRRLSYGIKDATNRPHMGRGRKIVPGQKIHASVLLKPHYRPKAKLCSPDDTWPTCVDFNDPCELEKLTDLDDKWEKDHFDPAMATFLVDKLRQPGCQPLEFIIRLCHIASLSLWSALSTLLAHLSRSFSGEGKSAINDIVGAFTTIEDLFANEDKSAKVCAVVTRALIADVPSDCQSRILSCGYIDAVLALLEDDKVDWQCRALSALATTGRLDFLRRHIVTDHILRIILDKCNSRNDKVRNCSARVLSCLLDHQNVEQDTVVVQLKINIQDAVESLLQSKHDLARAAGASIINVLVKHGTAPPYVLAGKALTDKVVPWVVKALEADDLTSFSCVTQLLRSFSHHGRLGDIMSVTHQVSPSSVVSAIVRWFDRDIPKAFSVAIAALFAMVQPRDVSPDAIRDAIQNRVWRSNALQMLITKALKSPDDWIVYYAITALQLFVDDDASRAYILQASESHVFPAIRQILKQVKIGEVGEDRIRQTLDMFAKHGNLHPVLSETIQILVATLDGDDATLTDRATSSGNAGDVIYRIASALSSIAVQDDGLRDVLSKSSIVSNLVRKLVSAPIDCPRLHNICRGLCVLAKHDEIKDKIRQSGAILFLKRRRIPIGDNDTIWLCATECLKEFNMYGLQ